jgi:uncharacterized protein YggE
MLQDKGVVRLALAAAAAGALLVSPGWAGGWAAPAAAVESGAGITTTGYGELETAAAGLQVLNIGFNDRLPQDDLDTALRRMDERVTAAFSALVEAGVPAASIRRGGINIGAGSGAPGGEPQFSLNAALQVEVSQPERLPAAVRAAGATGPSSVQVTTRSPRPAPPSGETLAPAITVALDQARANARATASGSGLLLGEVRSVTIGQPVTVSTGPGFNQVWRVPATVTFNVTG